MTDQQQPAPAVESAEDFLRVLDGCTSAQELDTTRDWERRIRADERALLEARIAELREQLRLANVDQWNAEGVARGFEQERDVVLARVQRAEEALRQIATTTVGGGGERIAQHLRDVASRALNPPTSGRAGETEGGERE